MFCVGKFPAENDAVAVFPKCWMAGSNKCFWPDKKKASKYVKKQKQPEDDWTLCDVVVLMEYETFKEANRNLGLATVTSDLEIPGTIKNKAVVQSTPPSAPGTFGIPKTLNFELVSSDNHQNVPIVSVSDVEEITGQAISFDDELAEASSFQACCTKHEGLILEMGQDITVLKNKVNEQGEILAQILNHVIALTKRDPAPSEGQPDDSSLTDLVPLPVNTIQDLTVLNEFTASVNGRRLLKKFLVGTGGSTVEEAVRRTLDKLIADDIMVKFSLKGKRGKQSFSEDYKALCLAINEAVRSYPSISLAVEGGQADGKVFELAMAACFKKAYDRVCQRKRKASSNNGPAVLG